MMPCPLDPRIKVVFVDPTDLGPTRLDRSHAFAVYGEGIEEPFIVVDQRLFAEDWFTEDHLMVLLAHEAAHILCRSTNEFVADRIGMLLLQKLGFGDAWALHNAEYEERMAAGLYRKAA
jgi:Zn-dependent protease with chaperone function